MVLSVAVQRAEQVLAWIVYRTTIRIDIKDLTIAQYAEINPKTDNAIIINKDTKTIKPQGLKYMFDTIPYRKFTTV